VQGRDVGSALRKGGISRGKMLSGNTGPRGNDRRDPGGEMRLLVASTRTSSLIGVRPPTAPLPFPGGRAAAWLQVERQFRNLVEQNHATGGQFELACLSAGGTGERTLLVAEQSGFQQVLGIAAQFTATNGPAARLECWWMSARTLPCRRRIRRLAGRSPRWPHAPRQVEHDAGGGILATTSPSCASALLR